MKRLVTNERERVGKWVAEQVDRPAPWIKEAALGLERDGELVAGIVIDGVCPKARGSMHCAIANKYGMNREFIFACFDYAFRVLDLKVLLNPVAESNAASLRFTQHMGFKEIARIPQAWDGEEALILFQLHRDDCRWLGV